MITNREIYRTGRLTAKPANGKEKNESFPSVQSLELAEGRDGLIYVPEGYQKDRPASLAVVLHGAGGEAQHGLSLLRKYADEHNLILLAPESRASTWDIIVRDEFDHDVIFINQALELTFDRFVIDPGHIAIGGFSDGASYALSLGLSNGSLFTHILAFSPGFAYTIEKSKKPEIFISHGIHDSVLPITPCSRRIVTQFEQEGLYVNYIEFDGGHEVPLNISKTAVEWFLNPNQ